MARLQLLPRTINGRLTLWFLLIALVTSAFQVVSIFLVIRRGIEQDVRDQIEYALNDRKTELEDWIDERSREMQLISSAAMLRESLQAYADRQPGAAGPEDAAPVNDEAARTQAVDAVRRSIEGFSKVLNYPNMLVFDPAGVLLCQMNAGFPLEGDIASGPLRETGLARAIQEARTQRTIVAAPPQRYPNIEDDRDLFFLAGPIQQGDRLLGILVLQLDNSGFDVIFATYTGLGETGDTYAGRLEGKQAIITAPLRNDPTGTYARRPYSLGGPEAQALQEAVQKQEGYGYRNDYRGVRCVAAWAYEPRLDLGVVVEQAVSEAYSWIALFRWASLGVLGITALIVVPLAFFVARSFSRPLQQAAELAGRVASGDLTAEAQHTESGEVGRLIDAIRDMTGHLGRLIGHIQQSIITLMATATEIAATSRQQQQTVDEFGISTTQVASAVNEISATSQELRRTMGEVHGAANQAAELASVGQHGLSGMHETMTRLADSTGSISSRLSVISERANNINLVVTTITKVADQTNLLSINAAIEAEKAGESGRGFLVVAREIRRLADRTAESTLDIERIVKEMQHSVTAGVMEMDKFNEQVRRGVGEVETIADQLGQVISSVQVLLPRFDQLNEGMTAQSQGADQIREAMASLQEGAARTAESLREFNRATDQLRDAVGGLKEDISKFTT